MKKASKENPTNEDILASQIEMLKWATNEDDFNQLSAYVIKQVRNDFKKNGVIINDAISRAEMRNQIMDSVRRFQKKHVSIIIYARMRLRRYLLKANSTRQP
jgi:hypothetical protein